MWWFHGRALGLIRTYFHYAVDLLDSPAKAPGWNYTATAILDGYGRGSALPIGLTIGQRVMEAK